MLNNTYSPNAELTRLAEASPILMYWPKIYTHPSPSDKTCTKYTYTSQETHINSTQVEQDY
jgi:hypothetical protein